MEKNSYEEIMSAALALPPGARAMLAEHLMESLDAEDQEELISFELKKLSDAIKKSKMD